MRKLIGKLIARVAPNTYDVIQAIRSRRLECRLQEQWGLAPLTREFTARYGWTVRHGPFAGMELPPQTTRGGIVSKLLGAYEQELHEAIEQAVSRPWATVLDVGCADGYYAVGFARRIPSATVYAFDLDPEARRLCRFAARANGVADRVQVRGRCEPATLQRLLAPPALVFSDCEGFEATLLEPRAAPSLRQACVIVELHEFASPGIEAELRRRFQPTHAIDRLVLGSRDADRFIELDWLDPQQKLRLISEHRQTQQAFLVLRPSDLAR